MTLRFRGKVVGGKRIGHSLGFPTANISPLERVESPQNGVYAARIWLPGEAEARKCVLNQGAHPTFPDGAPTIEAHIIGFEGDIYGEIVTLEYVKFMRAERKFANMEELRAQIAADIETALEF